MAYSKHQISREYPSESSVQNQSKEKVKTHAQGLVKDQRLDLMLRMEHELVRLAEVIGWTSLAESLGALYSEKAGRPQGFRSERWRG